MSQFNVAVFISGGGTNLQSILDFSKNNDAHYSVGVVISSNPEAFGLQRAEKAGVDGIAISRLQFDSRKDYVSKLLKTLLGKNISLIVLAGFMKKLPPEIVNEWENKILNIHPALLPSFGGKGYYGLKVHESVLEYGSKISGVTIHLADEKYDHGPIVHQAVVPVFPDDTPEILQKRVLVLEHSEYPRVIDWFAQGKVQIHGRKVYTPINL